MTPSIDLPYGIQIRATDKEVGRINDLYFHDDSWAICYIVADTGNWLRRRRVLLSPRDFDTAHQADRIWTVKLTGQQIENAPPIGTGLPISRQLEEEHCRYYGWPAYWENKAHLDANGHVVAGQPAKSLSHSARDSHLRSTKATTGYEVHGKDGRMGYVAGFRLDWNRRKLVELVLDLLPDFEGELIRIPIDRTIRISAEESRWWVDLARPEIAAYLAKQTGDTY